jgi:hypothetical protein
MTKKTLHYVIHTGEGERIYGKLYPTGKWRICYSPFYDIPMLEIQHQGILFTRWISEDEITERYPELNFVNVCGE